MLLISAEIIFIVWHTRLRYATVRLILFAPTLNFWLFSWLIEDSIKGLCKTTVYKLESPSFVAREWHQDSAVRSRITVTRFRVDFERWFRTVRAKYCKIWSYYTFSVSLANYESPYQQNSRGMICANILGWILSHESICWTLAF